MRQMYQAVSVFAIQKHQYTNGSFAGLLKDIPNPELLLSSTPISAADLNMVCVHASKFGPLIMFFLCL